MQQTFESLPVKDALKSSLASQNFVQMTEIQALSLPAILAGKDVLAQAKTGSGKTLAFALGLLQQLELNRSDVQGLVLCPTRELADQVAEEIRKLGRTLENLKVLTLCGGAPMGPQISSLSHGAHVVVGTPGRIMDHLLKKRLAIQAVKCLILDEADRMLDMGFAEELDTVIAHLPLERQSLLFSATYPPGIKQISAKVQRSPLEVSATSVHSTNDIEQAVYEVDEAHRMRAVAAVLTHYQPQSSIVFCNTRVACHAVADELSALGFSALALSGELEQRQRNDVLNCFASGSALTLVATDVAARGLDIEDVGLVVNYQLPDEDDVYVHRIGRTGRGGAKGKACSLVTPADNARLQRLADTLNTKFNVRDISAVRFHANRIVQPAFQTLRLEGGKKDKLRPGDILGALTKDADVPVEDVGKIKVTANQTYVAIKIRSVKRSMTQFRDGRIKGRKFRVRKL